MAKYGVLAVVLALPFALSGQQNQSVPDAPTPRSADNLKNLTSGVAPGKGTVPDATDNSADAPPVAPAAAPSAGQAQQKAPFIPAPGDLDKDIPLFVTHVNYVPIPVTVLDKKHQQVAGLTWRDFQVYENNQRQNIAFFSADSVGLSVALVIDQSLPQDVMRKVNESMAAIQGAFTSVDEVAVFTYADGVNNPTTFTSAQGARLPAVLDASKRDGDYMGAPINSGPFSGGPTINGRSVDPNLEPQRDASGSFIVIPKEVHTLNDAILAAGKALSNRDPDRRRIIYVISDGKESRSKANYKEVVRYLQGNQIAVYGTIVGDSAIWGLGYLDRVKLPLLPLSPDNILPRYTTDTGGHLESEFSENGIQRSFGDLAALARTQYTIGFYSHLSPLDGKFRSIDIRVLRPNLEVVAKKGYYPTATNMSR